MTLEPRWLDSSASLGDVPEAGMGQGGGWGGKDANYRPLSIYLFCLLMKMTNLGQRPHDPSSQPWAPGLGSS